jgi:hypothetical protein
VVPAVNGTAVNVARLFAFFLGALDGQRLQLQQVHLPLDHQQVLAQPCTFLAEQFATKHTGVRKRLEVKEVLAVRLSELDPGDAIVPVGKEKTQPSGVSFDTALQLVANSINVNL